MLLQMLGILLVVIVLAFGYLCQDYHQHRWPAKNFPPGPYGWPVLGSPIMMNPQVHLEFEELCHKYGNVFSMALGRFVVVVVNGKQAIKEAIVTNMNATASRGENYVQKLYNPGFKGIIDGIYSENWSRQRHFTHTTLRSFGVGKTSYEEKVMVEVDKTLDRFKQKLGQPFNPSMLLSVATTNITCTATMGVRFNCTDDKFIRLSKYSQRWLDTMYRSHALNAFPFIRPFAKKLKDDVKEAFESLAGFVREEIENHEARFDVDSEPRDFIDCYLTEMRSDPKHYTREDLTFILVDLFLAGNQTVALVLTCVFLHMIRNPEIQEKVHQEIVEEVGCTRLPTMKDRDNLPYTVAVIKEVLRHFSQTPVLSRGATKDFVLDGYSIPKGTNLMINLWSVHHDPKVWQNAHDFNPDRFMDSSLLGGHTTGVLTDNDNLLPFGAGRKACMGRQLGNMELFLFFACTMQRFKISVPPGYDKPSDTLTTKFLNNPPFYELVVNSRY